MTLIPRTIRETEKPLVLRSQRTREHNDVWTVRIKPALKPCKPLSPYRHLPHPLRRRLPASSVREWSPATMLNAQLAVAIVTGRSLQQYHKHYHISTTSNILANILHAKIAQPQAYLQRRSLSARLPGLFFFLLLFLIHHETLIACGSVVVCRRSDLMECICK